MLFKKKTTKSKKDEDGKADPKAETREIDVKELEELMRQRAVESEELENLKNGVDTKAQRIVEMAKKYQQMIDTANNNKDGKKKEDDDDEEARDTPKDTGEGDTP